MAYSVAPYGALNQPLLSCYLYRPSAREWRVEYPYDRPARTEPLWPQLHVCAAGMPSGPASLSLAALGAGNGCPPLALDALVRNNVLEVASRVDESWCTASGVAWELRSREGGRLSGEAPFEWSRFSGRVLFRDGVPRSSYIRMTPVDFDAPGAFTVPVAADGTFSAEVPARVYAILNANSGGYAYDALERWAWDYDLTHDRQDTFTIGRTELYGMRAFDIKSPLPTLFVLFRPSSLSRVRRFGADEPRLLHEEEVARQLEAMAASPTAIGPELRPEDVKVWLDGEEQRVVRLDQIPECDGDIWQVQYLVQIYPSPRPVRNRWYEVRVQVESTEVLHGRSVQDFGEGSVGFLRT
ncbi:MAG: hypothetical protein AB1505_24980 [Candidatus Latescibacterota bacterium]